MKISRFSIIVYEGGEAGLPIIGMPGMFSTFFFHNLNFSLCSKGLRQCFSSAKNMRCRSEFCE